MSNELLVNLDKIHTTELGIVRIKRNLSLDTDDIVLWCKEKCRTADSITRQGKNWYVRGGNVVITINAYSYSIITAHVAK